jgi:hypothetical protein
LGRRSIRELARMRWSTLELRDECGRRNGRWGLGCARKVGLVKEDVPTDKCLLCHRVNAAPALDSMLKAHEDTVQRVGLQALALVLAHMDVGTTPKDTKVREVGLVPMPCLKGGGVWERRRGQAFQDTGHVLEGLPPIRGRKLGLQEHRSDAFSKCPIASFSNAILLGSGTDGAFVQNSLLGKESVPFLAHVLATLVVTEDADLLASLALNEGLVRQKSGVGLVF